MNILAPMIEISAKRSFSAARTARALCPAQAARGIRSLAIPLFALFAAIAPLAAAPALSDSVTADEIVALVDRNEVYRSIHYVGRMAIEYKGKRFVKEFEAWTRANADSYVEFTNPEDRGTKYLKKDGRLYVYSPDTEQTMLISGHLLKESMMGSDLSYEDTIENRTLGERYSATLAGTESVDGAPCRVVDLTARKKTESYQKMRLWVSVETGDLVKYELYALSGAKLKEYRLLRAETIGGRRFPMESEMRDLLRKDSRTVFTMTGVELDASIDDSVFSMRNLER